jgi:hypothetical protein
MTVKERFEKWFIPAEFDAAVKWLSVRQFAERAYRAGRRDALREMKDTLYGDLEG